MSRWAERLLLNGIGAWNKGDIDAVLPGVHPDVDWRPPVGGPDGNVYRGHEGFRQWRRDLEQAFEELRFDELEVRGTRTRALVMSRLRARSRQGETIDMPVLHVVDLDGERAVRYEGFLAPDDDLLDAMGWT